MLRFSSRKALPDPGWGRRWPLVLALAAWLVAGAVSTRWVLRWVESSPLPPGAVAGAVPQSASLAQHEVAVSSLLNAPKTEAENQVMSSSEAQFSFHGVIAGQSGLTGAALLAVDGKPARPYAVGTVVASGLVLGRVTPTAAVLVKAGTGQVVHTLRLPEKK